MGTTTFASLIIHSIVLNYGLTNRASIVNRAMGGRAEERETEAEEGVGWPNDFVNCGLLIFKKKIRLI